MQPHTKRVAEGGFSVIEILVVLSVSMVVLSAVFMLFKNSLTISNTTFELTDAQENVRTAHEYINRDLILAGDGLNSINNIQVAQGFVLNYLSRNVVAGTPVGYVNLPVVSSDADVPGTIAVAGSSPAANVLGGTDRITILTLDYTFTPSITIASGAITGYGATMTMAATDAARLNVGEIYCFVSQSGAAFGTITAITTSGSTSTVSFANTTAAYGLNQPSTTGPLNLVGAGNASGVSTQAVSMIRVKIIHYYVNSRNELVKRIFGVAGAGFTDNLVAEHITDLSFRYILGSTNTNGTVQQPTNQLTTSTQQVAVRQIETSVTGETTHVTNFQTNTRSAYTMITTAGIRTLQFRLAQQPQSGG